MKKFLLTLAAAAMTTAMVNAAETTLDFVNVKADNIDGKFVPKVDGGAGDHYELGAFVLDGYTFALNKTDAKNTTPCLYTGTTMSTLRIYAGAILTITAPQGTDMGTITFNLSKDAAGVDAANNLTATDGTVTVNGNVITWNGSKAANSVTLTMPTAEGADGKNPNVQIKNVVVNTEVTAAPEAPKAYEWTKAGMPETNTQYVMVMGNQYGAPIAADKTYGRLTLTDCTIANDAFEAPASVGILFVKEDKGWTMKDAEGRFLGMDAEHLTSFQLYTELNDGCYWTIEETDKGLKISSVLNPTAFVSQSQGVNKDTNETYWYTNVAPAVNPDPYNLPTLYKQGKEVAGGDTPAQPVYAEWPFMKADNVKAGYMVLVCDGQLATPIGKDFTYGYLKLADVTIADNKLRCSSENAIKVEGDAAKFTMTDAYGRYLAMDETHSSSFQLYTELNDGCYWSATAEADGVKISNARQTESFVCKSKNKDGEWYTTIAPSKAPAEFVLPVVYVLDEAGVAGIEADANAPVEYYDLQGRRVANPEKGLYIKRQGARATKVIL